MNNSNIGAVVAWTPDLFLRSRIGELVNSQGLKAQFATNITDFKALVSHAPRLVILDLASDEYDPISLAKALKEERPGLKLLGFYPHVRKDLEEKARRAGVDLIVPNSGFLQSLRKNLQVGRDKS